MKRKINNAYSTMAGAKEQFNCFGCSPYNELGLRMEFYEEDGKTISEWTPQRRFEGFTNVLHGGIQATLMDEIANWVVCTQCKTAGVTGGMEVKYRRPVMVSDGDIKLVATLKEKNRRTAVIDVDLFNGKGELATQAIVTCVIFSEELAKTKYMYPGAEMFYEE
ncbi:PaaI family thioesterase [Puteibacter caeruleilacunae]|nr:PaaI family thioesterase [Puteibacter caeruleilacunae]